MPNYQLDRLDMRILRMLSGNGRKPYLEIARECNVSGAAIHQRIAKLNASKIIRSVETILEPEVIGLNVCAFAYITVEGDIEHAIEALKQIPEVVECHVVMGDEQILIKLYARDVNHLDDLLNNKIRPIGIARMRPCLSLREAFHRPMPIEQID